ncbi:MAG TPA: TonB-dependent receptor [Bacteroidota bacterium]|nr:TonB-dependent receptor [Bacteroidota bacterium]
MKAEKRSLQLFFCVAALIFLSENCFSQNRVVIGGRVVDAAGGAPLWGVNVRVKGTALGASTNDKGNFEISNISPGTYTLIFSYVGYSTVEREVKADANTTPNVEVSLSESVITGQEVVITAQMKGQQAAMNQQITSNSIVNVLSQDRIRELPDQNAAEAISRLPGISVERDGGEAEKVIIHGLDPKYSNITINGEKIPSTDLEDRSVDLSSISSDMLAGVEVYKSPTPDRDGDAIGGTVNFAMKKAGDDPSMDMRMEGGYNALEQDHGDYKGSVTLSRRLLDNALGMVVTGSVQKVNRSSDGQEEVYSLSYEPVPGAPIPYKIDDMRLVDTREIRKRYGASLALDYDLGVDNSFFLTGFWSKTDRDEARRRQRFNVEEARLEYDYLDHDLGTQLFTLSLNGNHHILLPVVGILDVDWRASISQSDQKNPGELSGRFFQYGIPGAVANEGPSNLPPSVTLDPNNTSLYSMTYLTESVVDKNSTYQLDAKNNFAWGDWLSGYLKFGGKASLKARERNVSQILSNTSIATNLGLAIYNNPTAFYRTFPLTTDVNHKVLMSGFLSSDDQIGEFLNGKYPSWPSLSGTALHDFWNNMRYYTFPSSSLAPIFDNNQSDEDDQLAAGQSYSADEGVYAGYIMAEFNIGAGFMILPGVRYERTGTDYKTLFGMNETTGEETPNIVNVQDSTGKGSSDEWLPMVQMRLNVMDGVALRASAAKTLSRPNFYDLVPYEEINASSSPKTIEKGNPSLKDVSASNYDLSLSFFNDYGLVTLGGFYKSLEDVSYTRTSYIFSGTYKGYEIIQPVNAADPSTVYGGEIEVQANLTLLPKPFDGLIVYGNIALMKSRTLYPRFQVTNLVTPVPPFLVVSVVDTVRSAPMPGQADKTGNLTLGYERGGFSGRLSFVFQGRSLAVVGTRAETDGYTDPYYRWDLALQQKIFGGISIYFNLDNITAVEDRSSNERYVTLEQYYGQTAELGLRYKF